MMGVWFLINFVANWLAGIIGSYAETLGELSIFGGLAANAFDGTVRPFAASMLLFMAIAAACIWWGTADPARRT